MIAYCIPLQRQAFGRISIVVAYLYPNSAAKPVVVVVDNPDGVACLPGGRNRRSRRENEKEGSFGRFFSEHNNPLIFRVQSSFTSYLPKAPLKCMTATDNAERKALHVSPSALLFIHVWECNRWGNDVSEARWSGC